MTFSLLPALRAVLRTTALTSGHTRRIEGAADHMITNTGEVLNSATTDEHQGVLLKVVPLARDVGGDLHPVRETNTSDLTKR
jgi:hypothetical protein